MKTSTQKSSHFGKRPYIWNQIRTTFSRACRLVKLCIQNTQSWKSRTPGQYWTIFTQSIKYMGLKSLFFWKIWRHTHYDKQLGAWISHYLVGCTLDGNLFHFKLGLAGPTNHRQLTDNTSKILKINMNSTCIYAWERTIAATKKLWYCFSQKSEKTLVTINSFLRPWNYRPRSSCMCNALRPFHYTIGKIW